MQKGKRKAERGPWAENQPVSGLKFLALTSICVPFFYLLHVVGLHIWLY